MNIKLIQNYKKTKEIQGQINKLRDELHKLNTERENEFNLTLVGRYFCRWVDSSEQYTEYTAYTGINELGDCIGWYFRAYYDNKLEVSSLKQYIVLDTYIDDSTELNKQEFFITWNRIREQLNNIENLDKVE